MTTIIRLAGLRPYDAQVSSDVRLTCLKTASTCPRKAKSPVPRKARLQDSSREADGSQRESNVRVALAARKTIIKDHTDTDLLHKKPTSRFDFSGSISGQQIRPSAIVRV